MSPPFAGAWEIMQDTDAFEQDWRDRGLGRPLHREMTFTHAGIALGRGTILAEFEKKGRGTGSLALDGNEARILSLTAAFGTPVAPEASSKRFAAPGNFGAQATRRRRKSISPSSACRRSTRRTPTASSSPGRRSKKAPAQVI